MSVIVQRRHPVLVEYSIPVNGIAIWYGIAANLPAGWTIDTACDDVFVRGCDTGEATDTISGSFAHEHSVDPSGSVADHTHNYDGGLGNASGSTTHFPTSNDYTAPSGHSHSISLGASGSGGVHSHTLVPTASIDAYPPYAKLYWIKNTSAGDLSLPLNGIIMWDNPAASLPTELAICDGNNGTIDLQDKFIYGAPTDGDIGDNGGALTHTHANSDAPAAGSHTHSLNRSSTGASSSKIASTYAGTTVAKAGHNHGISGTSPSQAAHTHTIPNTNSESNLPAYLKLYFIQRII